MPRLALGKGKGPVVVLPHGSTMRVKEVHGAVQDAAPSIVDCRNGWLAPVIRSTLLGSVSVAGRYFSPIVNRMEILVGPCCQPLKNTTGHAPCKPQVNFKQMVSSRESMIFAIVHF